MPLRDAACELPRDGEVEREVGRGGESDAEIEDRKGGQDREHRERPPRRARRPGRVLILWGNRHRCGRPMLVRGPGESPKVVCGSGVVESGMGESNHHDGEAAPAVKRYALSVQRRHGGSKSMVGMISSGGKSTSNSSAARFQGAADWRSGAVPAPSRGCHDNRLQVGTQERPHSDRTEDDKQRHHPAASQPAYDIVVLTP